MIPNVVKGSGFRGLTNYLLVGRQKATIVGGNMAGRNALELTREFGIGRRLRPGAAKPVMHHTLSFADGEDPGDTTISQAAERYIQSMGLDQHQWVAVVHRDKAHVHVHLAINRIGLDGSWWNATHDYARSQVIAAQVEVAFGFVQVPRIRLQLAIQKSLKDKVILPPENGPLKPELDVHIKHVLGEIRAILEGLPYPLSASQWISAVHAQGLHLKPSIGGEKLSGFTVRLPGHRAVKLSDVHRSLSWPKLLASGRVHYDPLADFAEISNLKHLEPNHDPSTGPTVVLEAKSYSGDSERTFDQRTGLWSWAWQPVQPDLVDREMGPSFGADTPLAGESKAPPIADFGQTKSPGSDATPVGGVGAPLSGERRVPAAGIRVDEVAVGEVPSGQDVDLSSCTNSRPLEHLLGGYSEHGSGGGTQGDSGVHATRTIAGAEGPSDPPQTSGGLAEPVGGDFARGSVPLGAGSGGQDHRGSDAGWGGLPGDARELIGSQADFEDLGLHPSSIPPGTHEAARFVLVRETPHRLPKRELAVRAGGRDMLWEETQAEGRSHDQYRNAKALATALGDQGGLESARAVIRELTRMAKAGGAVRVAMPGKTGKPGVQNRAMVIPASDARAIDVQRGRGKRHKT